MTFWLCSEHTLLHGFPAVAGSLELSRTFLQGSSIEGAEEEIQGGNGLEEELCTGVLRVMS